MLKTLLAAALIAGGTFAAPAVAAPLAPAAPAIETGSDITPVHYRGRRHYHRRYRRSKPRVSFGVQLNFGPSYGYRDPYYRPHYRPRKAYRAYGSRHHNWCSNRYRSYRVSDGTYQPYHGHRRRCNSPYDGI